MITCIKCSAFIGHNSGTLSSICQKCAGELADELSPKDLMAMARVGLDAVIDEVTGYQEVRPEGELAKRHKEYKEDK